MLATEQVYGWTYQHCSQSHKEHTHAAWLCLKNAKIRLIFKFIVYGTFFRTLEYPSLRTCKFHALLDVTARSYTGRKLKLINTGHAVGNSTWQAWLSLDVS